MRVRFIAFSTLLAAAAVSVTSQLYANGLVPVYSSPMPYALSGVGLYLSLFFVLAGLTIALRRMGFRATIPLLFSCVLAALATCVCIEFLQKEDGLQPALFAGAVALFLSLTLQLIWYRRAARKGVIVRNVFLLLACAIVLVLLSMLVIRLSIDHWQ